MREVQERHSWRSRGGMSRRAARWYGFGPVVGSKIFQPVALWRSQTLGGYRADAYGGAWTVHWLAGDPEKDRARVAGSTPAPSRKPSVLEAGEPWCGADGAPVWVHLTSLSERLHDAQRHAPHKFSKEK